MHLTGVVAFVRQTRGFSAGSYRLVLISEVIECGSACTLGFVGRQWC
jgi:hypothetical protein